MQNATIATEEKAEQIGTGRGVFIHPFDEIGVTIAVDLILAYFLLWNHFLVDPWNVQGAVVDGKQLAIDYDRLIEAFGTRAIDEATLQRMETLTGRKPHVFLRRGLFFSHRYGRKGCAGRRGNCGQRGVCSHSVSHLMRHRFYSSWEHRDMG